MNDNYILLSYMAAGCVLITILFVVFFLFKLKPTAKNKTDVKNTIDERTAVHEAGHLLISYYCSDVVKVTKCSIDVDESGNAITTGIWKLDRNKWNELVVMLGGIAGELSLYNKFRSGGASSDLMVARSLATDIINSNILPPWTTDDITVYNLPFSNMFTTELSIEEEIILNTAYNKSKSVLVVHQNLYIKLINLLLEKRTITEDDVEKILGSRFAIQFLGNFKSTIYSGPQSKWLN